MKSTTLLSKKLAVDLVSRLLYGGGEEQCRAFGRFGKQAKICINPITHPLNPKFSNMRPTLHFVLFDAVLSIFNLKMYMHLLKYHNYVISMMNTIKNRTILIEPPPREPES